MKRCFVVEADTKYDSLFCYEVTEGDQGKYERIVGDGAIFNNCNREQFFGHLNALCTSKANIQAQPIKLAEPEEKVMA